MERRDGGELPTERYVWASNLMDSCKQIADVGCGFGYGTHILRKHYLAVGIDISREALDYAAKKYPGPYVLANAEVNTFAGFDGVVCLEALSHMLDPYTWIKNLAVKEIVISAPLTPSTAIYPWRKHDIPPEMFRSMFTPKWQILNEFSQDASPTERYLTVHARIP